MSLGLLFAVLLLNETFELVALILTVPVDVLYIAPPLVVAELLEKLVSVAVREL
jgi:hypothetical protein